MKVLILLAKVTIKDNKGINYSSVDRLTFVSGKNIRYWLIEEGFQIEVRCG